MIRLSLFRLSSLWFGLGLANDSESGSERLVGINLLFEEKRNKAKTFANTLVPAITLDVNVDHVFVLIRRIERKSLFVRVWKSRTILAWISYQIVGNNGENTPNYKTFLFKETLKLKYWFSQCPSEPFPSPNFTPSDGASSPAQPAILVAVVQ